MRSFFFAAGCLAVLSFALFAQEYRASVLGRIMDPSGAVLPDATIALTNEETNVTLEAKANQEGLYNIPFVLPGRYTVRVSATGFQTTVRPGIVVQINDRITLDFTLQIGATADTVTVSEQTPILQTASGDLGAVIERHVIDRLPMSGMNAMNLADLAPGVLGGSGSQISNTQNEITINGSSGRERGNDITIDGIPNVAPRFNGLAVTVPSSDAIQEFRVATTMFDAQNGRSNGGAISFTTRGGTNTFRGSASYFLYNQHLNANGWTRNRNNLPRQPPNQYMAGATIGGPVMLPEIGPVPGYNGRNRSFFFFAYERRRSHNDAPRFARVPTELERKGDFSKTLSLTNTPLGMYDPYTTRIEGGRTLRDPFPNMTIPASRHDVTGSAVMNLYPLPNQSVTPRIGTFNWLGTGRFRNQLNNYTARFDQVISIMQRFYFRYGQVYSLDTYDPPAMRGVYSIPTSATSTSVEETSPRRNQSAGIDHSVTFTPRLVGSFRYGYTRTYLFGMAEGNRYSAEEMKMPRIVIENQVARGYPMIVMGENMPQFGSRLRTSVNDTHSLYVTFSQLQGRHAIKYGLDMRVVRWNENQPGLAQNGQFPFSTRFVRSDPTSTASQNTSGTAMGALLLGLPDDGRIGYNSALSLQSWYTALYFQDDFKITRRLMLNLGLRWELEIPQTERFDRIAYGMDPNYELPLKIPGLPPLRGAILFVNTEGRGRRQGETDYNNFGPRFGFAYQLGANTAVRGGYGLYFASGLSNISPSTVSVNALGSQPAFNTLTRIPNGNSTDGGRTPVTTIQNPFPHGISQPTGTALGPLTELGNSISYANPFRVIPYNQQWQFSIQRVIGWNTMVDVGYVGSHALKQFNDYNWNERSDVWLREGVGEFTQIPNPFWGIFPATSTLGGSRTIAQGRLWYPFPQFNQVNVFGMNTDRALYHSGQVAVRKRMSHGLWATVNYTFSKNIVYDGASLVNERRWRTVAASDRPHIFRVFASYQMPFGRRQRFLNTAPGWLNAIVGGWEFAGTLRMTSGTPLSITQARGRPVPLWNPKLSGPVRERLGDRLDPVTGRPINPFFDTSAWQVLPNDYVISLEPPRYSWLRGPRGTFTSMTGYKVFSLSERFKFELRGEATNLLNHPIFANPALNMDNPATFGTITSASGARTINISGKLRF